MSTTEKGKFCAMCAKEVVDFTDKTNAEIAAHLKQAEGSVCGRLYSSQVIVNVKFSKFKYLFQRTKTYLATFIAVISASALFGEKAVAQDEHYMKGKMKFDRIPEQNTANTRETTIRGTVTLSDSNEAVPEAVIRVSSAGTVIQETRANSAGSYEVVIPPGAMQNQEISLTAYLSGYMHKTIESLKILKEEITLNFSMNEDYTLFGDMKYIPEDLINIGQVAIAPEHANDPKSTEKAQAKPVKEKTIEIISEIVMGDFIVIEEEPENITGEDNVDITETETPPIADSKLISDLAMSPQAAAEPKALDVNMIEHFTLGNMVYIEPELPLLNINIVDTPEQVNIDNEDGQELTTEETISKPLPLWENPFIQKKVKVINKLQKVRKLSKMRSLDPQIISNQEVITPIAVEQEPEPKTPIEDPEVVAIEQGEGTRETLEPILEPKMIVSVYPNPTTDYFNIDMGSDAAFLMELYDSQGRQVKITKLESPSSRIDISTLEPGSYLVRVSNAMGNQVETKTIIVI